MSVVNPISFNPSVQGPTNSPSKETLNTALNLAVAGLTHMAKENAQLKQALACSSESEFCGNKLDICVDDNIYCNYGCCGRNINYLS